MSQAEQESIVTAENLLWIKGLEGIKRYKGMEMIHRPDVWVHSRRTTYLAKYLGLLFNETDSAQLDLYKLTRMAWHHDDAELVTDDIISPLKAQFTPEQFLALQHDEERAAEAVGKYILGLSGQALNEYLEEQADIRGKKTTYAHVVEIADKWDAMGEILHEIRCGNTAFIDRVDFSRDKLEGFSNSRFWLTLLLHPALRFTEIPSHDEFTTLPTLTLADFPSRESVSQNMTGEAISSWPPLYRTWGEISQQIFHYNPEEYLFPGWYLKMWDQWGEYPSHTTVSGVTIAGGALPRRSGIVLPRGGDFYG